MILSYCLQVSVCWAMLYLLYILLLSRETYFSWNRAYLLTILLAGLCIPFLDQFVLNSEPGDLVPNTAYLRPVIISINSVEAFVETPPLERPYWYDPGLLQLIYWIGGGFYFLRLLVGSSLIYNLVRSGQVEKEAGVKVVFHQRELLPFSFFNYLFFHERLKREDEVLRQIKLHEKAHCRGWHSADVLVLELLSAIFWCSPPIYLIKRALKLQHEFIADATAIKTLNRKQYGQLLIRQSISGNPVAFVNHFSLQLKKRFAMMKRRRSTPLAYLKYGMTVPMLLFLVTVFGSKSDNFAGFSKVSFAVNLDEEQVREMFRKDLSGQTGELATTPAEISAKMEALLKTYRELVGRYPDERNTIQRLAREVAGELGIKMEPMGSDAFSYSFQGKVHYAGLSNQHPKEEIESEKVFKEVDELPVFGTCDGELVEEKLRECSDLNMLKHIYTNIKYPAAARDSNIQGMVVVKFVIDRDGQTREPLIVKAIGGGCDEEVLRVVKDMPEWTPARHEGRPVEFEFTLPVRFKISDEADEKPLKVVEQMPRFPGCEDRGLTKEELQNCSNGLLYNFIFNNIQYPKAAKEKSKEGTVLLSFVVEKDGSVSTLKILQDTEGAFGNEVLRVGKMLPDFTPGYQNGVAVRTSLNLPVKFILPKKDESGKIQGLPEQLELTEFRVSSNPTPDFFDLTFEATEGELQVQVSNLSGKAVYGYNTTAFKGVFNARIDLSGEPAGPYFLTIRQKNRAFTYKIIRQ